MFLIFADNFGDGAVPEGGAQVLQVPGLEPVGPVLVAAHAGQVRRGHGEQRQ